MIKQTLWEVVRMFIGDIGWSVFLWSIKMTQDQYINYVQNGGEYGGIEND